MRKRDGIFCENLTSYSLLQLFNSYKFGEIASYIPSFLCCCTTELSIEDCLPDVLLYL